MFTDFKPSSDLTKFNLKVKKIDDSIDRCAYTQSKTCTSCDTIVGKTGVKKFYCHFCYKAFCSACLTKTIVHPNSGDPELICNECFIYHAKMQVVEIGSEYVLYCLQKEIKLREAEIKQTNELRTQVELVRNEKMELEKQNLIKIEKKKQYLQELVKKFEDFDEELDKSACKLQLLFEKIANEDIKPELDKFLARINY